MIDIIVAWRRRVFTHTHGDWIHWSWRGRTEGGRALTVTHRIFSFWRERHFTFALFG